MTYAEKLLDPRWQKKRLCILERDKWTCQDCGATTKTFHVHHLDYINGKDPWEYPDEYLTSLCYECHAAIEEARKDFEKRIVHRFRFKLKDTFEMNCATQVFERYEDLSGLFYMLWEMLDKQDEVDGALRNKLFPNQLKFVG